MTKRPTSVTIFGILNIVFGAMGLLGLLMSLVMMNVKTPGGNPVLDMVKENDAYRTWYHVSMAVGVVASLFILAVGIGLMKLLPWGRWGSIGYAIFAIIWGLLGMLMNYALLVSPLMDKAEGQQEKFGAIGAGVGSLAGGCLGLVYAILLLIFMFRPNVVAAFKGEAPPPKHPQHPF